MVRQLTAVMFTDMVGYTALSRIGSVIVMNSLASLKGMRDSPHFTRCWTASSCRT